MRYQRKPQRSPHQIAKELADARHQPFYAFGRDWQGDIFYSSIYQVTKGMSPVAYKAVCDELRRLGYYVHS